MAPLNKPLQVFLEKSGKICKGFLVGIAEVSRLIPTYGEKQSDAPFVEVNGAL